MRFTRGGMALVGLVVFSLAVATPTNAAIFIVLSCLASLLLLNIPYALLAVRGVSVRRDHVSYIKEDTEMTVQLHVSNVSRRARLLLRLLDRGPSTGRNLPQQIPLLAGGEGQTASYTCSSGKRGVYHFVSCRIESSSPFGLMNARKRVRAQSDLVVYPLYYELPGAAFPFYKSFSGMTAAPGPRAGEGPSFFGLREYRQGDPIRKIHWPSTVRAQTVMIKEFEEDMHSSVTILLDSDRKSLVTVHDESNLEVAVRVAASLANYTLVNGHPTTLVSYDAEARAMRLDKAMGNLTPVLDGLARLDPSTQSSRDLVSGALGVSAKSANWIVVLLAASQETFSELLRIRAKGVEIVVVLVDRHGADGRGRPAWFPPMLQMFEEAGISVIMMTPDEDIQSCLSRNLRGPKKRRG